MKKIKLLLPALSLVLSACSHTQADDSHHKQLKQAFIEQQKTKGFSEQETKDFLAKAKFNQTILDTISRPWEAKPWYQYYPIFLTEKRLQAGLEFWQKYEKTIDKAAKVYGVDPQIIVAIIGIETFYGHYMGTYPVLDAVYTLGFYYPPRADFFRSELGNLQSLIKEENLPLMELKGSYAGAMGYGQFISSSYRHYAVDFDGDGQRDLLSNPVDAIGSVANYFHQHGWQYGKPVVLKLNNNVNEEIANEKPNAKVWAGEKLHYQVADILSADLTLAKSQDIDKKQPAMLIEVEPEKGKAAFYLGLNNFYVITRYNRSPLYALAVYEFSQMLKKAHDQLN